MIYRVTNSYKYFLLLGIIYFVIFAYNLENGRNFWTWMWLLASQINFIGAIRQVIVRNHKICSDSEIIAISEYIKLFKSHTDWVNAEYASIEKFGVEKTKIAMEYLKNR